MQEEAARGSKRFAKTVARMIRIGAAILLAVLASAAPCAGQHHHRRVTQRRVSLMVRVVDTFTSIAARLSNQNVKRISKGPWGPSKAAAASPRCSHTHVSLENSGSGVDSPNQQKAV
jgi:hypothetical protein